MTPTTDPTSSPAPRARRRLAWTAAPMIALSLAVACSGSSDTTTNAGAESSTTTASPGSSSTSVPEDPNEPTVLFDETIQKELQEVGCYTGAIDGLVGPATDAAILEFQSASGLYTDGELGPETDTALSAAASKKSKVCGAGTSTTTAKSGATTTTAKSGATTTTARSGPGTTNPNEANPGFAPCTATAIAANMAANTLLQTYVCVGQWSAGYETPPGGAKAKFIRQSVNNVWVTPASSPCGTPNLPAAITQHGCN